MCLRRLSLRLVADFKMAQILVSPSKEGHVLRQPINQMEALVVYLGGFDGLQHWGRHSTRQSKLGSKKKGICMKQKMVVRIEHGLAVKTHKCCTTLWSFVIRCGVPACAASKSTSRRRCFRSYRRRPQ